MSIFRQTRTKQSPAHMQKAQDVDAALLAKCRNGSRSAQFQLYEKYKDVVYNTALRMANDTQIAEDLTQEAFIKVFKNIGSFRGESAFSSWLYRIVSNVCINHFRSASRWKKLMRTSEHGALDNGTLQTANTEMAPHLEKAICRLPAGYRMVFVLHDVQGFRHEEISDMLDIAVGTSKSQLHKARKALRQALAPYLELLRALQR